MQTLKEDSDTCLNKSIYGQTKETSVWVRSSFLHGLKTSSVRSSKLCPKHGLAAPPYMGLILPLA